VKEECAIEYVLQLGRCKCKACRGSHEVRKKKKSISNSPLKIKMLENNNAEDPKKIGDMITKQTYLHGARDGKSGR